MKPLVVCIAGPTACGKTAAAVAVCRALNGEVISMDSMQIYRGMDVGTAKPDTAERGGIPHHMIDILPPTAAYSVSEYQRDAGKIVDEILGRGKLPVFAGGTGLYLQAVKHPMRFADVDGDEAVRSRLRAEAESEAGRDALWRRLCAEDPQSAARLHKNGLAVYATALHEDSEPLSSVPLEKAAVIIGSEGRGVTRQAIDLSDKRVVIPMHGRAESLNAGVAAAIVIYEMTK